MKSGSCSGTPIVSARRRADARSEPRAHATTDQAHPDANGRALPNEPIERQGWGAVTPAYAVAYALSLRQLRWKHLQNG